MQPGIGPRPYDVTTRQLIDTDPASWLALAGLAVDGTVRAVDSELSTVLAEVDKVLRVDGPAPWLAHLEIQAGRDRRLPLRLLQYHALLLHRHEQPVSSILVLLRPQPDSLDLTGTLVRRDGTGDISVTFAYRVLRIWQLPVNDFLTGGLGILPLAPLAAVERHELPSVIDRMAARLAREATPATAGDIWSMTLLLLGLRYDEHDAREVIRRMNWLRESVTYHMILDEGREEGRQEGREEGREQGRHAGRLEGERRLLLRLGNAKLGAPPPHVLAAIEAIDDVSRLEQLGVALLESTVTWETLVSGAGCG